MSQPETPTDRLRAGDKALAELFGHAVSINEAHALLLGAVGFLLGKRRHPLAAAALAGYAILAPPRIDRRIGSKTITHEPWYFVASIIGTYLFGRQLRDGS